MAGAVQIPRSRGSLCGLLLVLLGAWGGLIPFIGPYFHFAYTPDKAWAYTSGRLYLSIVPGAVALLGGLITLLTRSRAAGVFGGFLAALAGAWFITGYPVVLVVFKVTTVRPGSPVGPAGAVVLGRATMRTFAEQLGFFTGLGILILFIASIAIGRFTMIAAKDAEAAGSAADYEPYTEGRFPASQPDAPAGRPYPTPTGQFPESHETGQFPDSHETGQFPESHEEYSAAAPPFPPAQPPFPPSQEQYPTATGQIPEQQFPPSQE